MKKYIYFALIFIGLSLFNVSSAAVNRSALLAQAETVTLKDLGIEDAGILPTNPFYFFKELTRSFKRIITRDPIAKAELELKIVNEKAGELKKIEDLAGDNQVAVAKAIRNYRDSQEGLKEKLSALSTASNNPETEKLISALTERMVQHEKIFDNLGQKFSENKEIKDLTESSKGLLEQSLAVGSSKDDPKEFAEKVKESLLKSDGGDLRNAHSVEIIERFKDGASEDAKKELDVIKKEFSDQARKDIERLLKEKSVPELEVLLREFPDSSKKSEIGEKIFQKQKAELNSGVASPVSVKLPPQASFMAEIAVCDQIKKNLDETWNLFKSGSLTEQEYLQKYEVLKKQFAVCQVANEGATSTEILPVESGGAVVCTQQYDPVCGVNGKTYPNECVAKGSGELIQYKGECKVMEVDVSSSDRMDSSENLNKINVQ